MLARFPEESEQKRTAGPARRPARSTCASICSRRERAARAALLAAAGSRPRHLCEPSSLPPRG